MKKEIGIYEETTLVMLISLLVIAIEFIIDTTTENYFLSDRIILFYNYLNKLIMIISIFLFCIMLKNVYKITVVRKKKKLPRYIYYNNKYILEVHIGNMAKRKQEKFYILGLRILLYCLRYQKNIMFDTCFISKRNIKKYVNNNFKAVKPSNIQKITNAIFSFLYRNKSKRTYLRYIIYFDNLTNIEKKSITYNILYKLRQLRQL